jgi:hypothetical protein
VLATILLVEDALDLGAYEANVLEAQGHRVLRCGGGATPFSACTMMRYGSCPLPAAADLIVFSCGMIAVKHRSYRGVHLLRAYRQHAEYGRLPMLVVSFGVPSGLGGSGPMKVIDKFSSPQTILDAVSGLLGSRAEVSA